jgi:hypothetical protein
VRKHLERDRLIVQEMWTIANNEPLALSGLQPLGMIDRDRYRRTVDGISLELTLESDPHSGIWAYEFSLVDPDGVQVDEETVQYWLELFFGKETRHISKRSYLLTADARYTFPYQHR